MTSSTFQASTVCYAQILHRIRSVPTRPLRYMLWCTVGTVNNAMRALLRPKSEISHLFEIYYSRKNLLRCKIMGHCDLVVRISICFRLAIFILKREILTILDS